MAGAPSTRRVVAPNHKLTPPGLPAAVVARPRLDRLYAELLSEHEALAVFAAAGSGKTVQAQMFARSQEGELVWLTLDPTDLSPARLLANLTKAVGSHVVGPLPSSDFIGVSDGLVAAAALAEQLSSDRVLIVLDQCEVLADSPDACALLEAFLDYLPSNARTILTSRTELPMSLGRLLLTGRAARISDDDLALRLDEAVSLVAARGDGTDDVEGRWRAARGWVAGVAFAGRDSRLRFDPSRDFRSYLQREVFESLSDVEQQFLLDTSVLDAVSPRAVDVLCGPEGREVLHQISERHLPATTSTDGTIVYHPCFRSYLRERLEQSDAARWVRLQRLYAALLVEQHRYEDATELLFQLRALDEAAVAADRISEELIARGDWHTILRWCEQLGPERLNRSPSLLGAQVAALRGSRRLAEGRALVRRLEEQGRLTEVFEADPRSITHAAWTMLWQPSEGLALLDRHDVQRRAGGVRYLLQSTSGTTPVEPPHAQPWNEFDRLVSWGLMVQGRLRELVAMLPAADQWPPRSPFTTPHPLLGLVWRGELERARYLFEQMPLDEKARVYTDLWHYLEAWLLIAEGDPGSAAIIAEQAVAHSRLTGFGFEPVFQIAEAQALLGVGRVREAVALLEESIDVCRSAGQIAYVEWGLAFRGRAHLVENEAGDAISLLRESVAGMVKARRLLMLPIAATFLAEAEHRLGNEVEEDQAAIVAYDAAAQMGSFFTLQLALRDFPGVLERQRERSTDRDWHRVTVNESSGPTSEAHPVRARVVELQPFGNDPHLIVDGERVDIRRLKVMELVAFLAVRPNGVYREEVNLHLFPESDRRRGSNHFRQVVHQLRKATGLVLERRSDGRLTWAQGTVVEAHDVRAERLLSEARGLVGRERVERSTAALGEISGPYLANSELDWVSNRRFELEVLQEEAELDIAALALELKDFVRAKEFAHRVVERNPYVEKAYHILMEVESSIGTEAGRLATYRRMVAALGELGLPAGDVSVGEQLHRLHESSGTRQR